MIHYILQTLAFQLLFLLVYDLFLKKETFFNYNRVYLLFTIVLSLILPLIQVAAIQRTIPPEYYIQLPPVILGEVSLDPTLAAEKSSGLFQLSWMTLWYGGAIVSCLLFGYKLFKLLKLKRNGKKLNIQGLKVIAIDDTNSAFTFLNHIFLGTSLSEEQKSSILLHEQVHVKQKHSWDQLLFELLRIAFWFNPLIYIYQNRITALQEFAADAEVAKLKEKKTYYQELLSEVFQTQKISFINTFFNHSLIKKRIIMLQKSKSKKIYQLKYLLLIPIVGAMLIYTSCTQEVESSSSNAGLVLNASESGDVLSQIEALKATIAAKGEITPEEEEALRTLKKVQNEIAIAQSYADDIIDGVPLVPYALVDRVPTFPGCEGDPATLRKCTNGKIKDLVLKNFDISVADKAGLTGKIRIAVQFKIGSDGKIGDIRCKAPNKILEEEAQRMMSNFPNMIPGEKDGKRVSVLYSLPVIFEIVE